MTNMPPTGIIEQGWDAPWYRVRTDRFEASFLPGAGEDLGGRYFWCSDGLIVRDPGIDSMTQVLIGLLDEGDFTQALQRLDEDEDDEDPDDEDPDKDDPSEV